ncbi:MAG: SMI1/KNR4 family protein [Zoogloeaceae bacterium]|jgi:hypothetical protein|nr:SMI1/KNR4 family protein [Zoogloeaceae bacterium]
MIRDIWRKPPCLPYVQPELTDEAVREAEQTLGVKLPKEYIELLKIQNGGYIAYTLPESAAVNAVHDGIAGIGPNYPSLVENADLGLRRRHQRTARRLDSFRWRRALASLPRLPGKQERTRNNLH